MTSPRRLTGAALAAAAITTAQHIYFARKTLPREQRYALGVGAIIAGFAVWALPRQADALIALILVSGAAGVAPLAGYAVRRRQLRGKAKTDGWQD